MKKFITIFPNGENVHLIKDVGMIPYTLYKEGYYESYISFYQDEVGLDYFNTDVIGLKYIQLKRYFSSQNLNVFLFLVRNLLRFDVVMLFHPTYYSLFMMILVKILSLGRIKFYFKMDLNSKYDFTRLSSLRVKNILYCFLMKRANLLSVESYSDWLRFRDLGKFRVEHVSNGFIPAEETDIVKESIFLTVGRLGTYEKDTKTLLEAFARTNPNKYELWLIGPIEADFKDYVNDFLERNSALRNKIRFLGEISDRKILKEYYQRARVFVLTSRSEGFPLVFLEAASQGCYIVSSAFPASIDITDNEKYGKVFEVENVTELAEIFKSIDANQIEIPGYQSIRRYAVDKYDWKKVVKTIFNSLEK